MADNVIFQTQDALSQTNLGKAFGRANSTQYVEDGLDVTLNNDGTIDVATGVAHLLHDGQGVTAEPDARSGLTLPNGSGPNHVYLVVNVDRDNDISIERVDAEQSWSDASLKIATVDTSSSTVTQLARAPATEHRRADVETLQGRDGGPVTMGSRVDAGGNDIDNVGSFGTDKGRINSNESIYPGDVEGLSADVLVSVVDDSGTWFGVTQADEFIRSDNPLNGYEKVSDLPFTLTGSIRGLHMTASGDLITGAEGSIWLSTDGGATWSAVQSLADANDGLWGISENGRGDITAAEYGNAYAIYQSTDGGASWTKIADATDSPTANPSGQPDHYHDVAYDPNDDDTMIVTGHFVKPTIAMISRDNGSTWSSIEGISPWNINTGGVTWHPTEQDVFFFGTDGGDVDGVVRLRDDGGTGTVETFVNTKSATGGRNSSGMVFSIRAIEKPDGSHYFVGVTRREGLIGETNGTDNMIVASISDKGLRWRGISDAGHGREYLQTTQGPDKKTLPLSENPYLVHNRKVIDLHDAANPIYGHQMPSFVYGPGDTLAMWDTGRILMNEMELKTVANGDLDVYDKSGDGRRLLRLSPGGNVGIGDPNESTGRHQVFNNLDMNGNVLRPDGAGPALQINGGVRMWQQGTSEAQNQNGEIKYFDSDPAGSGRGAGFYGYEEGAWGKFSLTF